MSAKPMTTKVSSKGQIVLPSDIRQRRGWTVGATLIVEETSEGVLLKPAPLFPPTTVEEVFGSLHYEGPPKTIEEMDAGVAAEARRRYARD